MRKWKVIYRDTGGKARSFAVYADTLEDARRTAIGGLGVPYDLPIQVMPFVDAQREAS